MTGLYVDEQGRNISTNSMLKSFSRCPRQADYKYARRLKPKSLSLPLTRGKWMHSLLEAYYKGEDWKEVHAKYSSDFAKLFDEEKEKLGDLPRECSRLMRGYIWHYKNHKWKVLDVEGMIETEFPDGSIFRGKFDMLVEDEFGLWIVDHKNMKQFPTHILRLLDTQSARYVWAARKEGIPVQGFIWNYIKTKAQTVPTPIISGTRMSKTTMKSCDYMTASRALKDAKEKGMDISQYIPWLRNLKALQYEYGQPQASEFFYRNVLERSQEVLDRVAVETFHTSLRMHDYDFSVDRRDTVERVVDRSCEWMCGYADICTAELLGGNTDLILRKNYKEADPMEYYFDERVVDGN